MTLWLEVTTDKYELPLFVAGSAKELAKHCGVTENNVRSTVAHGIARGKHYRFIRVEVSDDPNEEG